MPPIHEELERIIPSLKKINSLNIPLSIETCRSEVVQEVIKYDNVRYINDTSGLSDKKIIDIIQPLDIQYILLHMPITYEKSNTINPKYNQDIMSELKCFFEEKLSLLKEMKMKKIIIDP
jgi:dihydropteroate synthase